MSEGIVSLPAKHLGEVPAGAPLSAVRQAVEAGYQHLDYAQRLSLATEYHSFLTKMQTEDIVATVAEGQLILGFILGDPEYLDDADTRLRRPVQWLQDASVALDALTPTLRALLDGQGAVVDLTAGLALLVPLAPLEIDDTDDVSIAVIEPLAAAADSVPALPRITQAFADSLHMPLDKLQEYAELLESRQQLVFYGPPGTGKTYVAKELADFAVGADNTSRVQLVQFHPSYSYEDFFEGFRPYETESGQASFRVTAGALRRLASEASKPENSSHPFILIIDEMNRANIAKVFGELYFLLEYRNSSISLQYNPNEQFRLPKNLFIIGTMNTADRSIALVDAAIRRRFPFVELHPQLSPVEGVLRRYLEAKGYSPERGLLLAKLNEDIEDRDMQIGPSYLMRKEASEPRGLARVWDYDILPLLTEHYYGRLSPEAVRSRFGLDSIRKNLGIAVEVAPETESGPEAEPVGDDGVEPTA
jgi:5-methylcytosine-specific restriction protein B